MNIKVFILSSMLTLSECDGPYTCITPNFMETERRSLMTIPSEAEFCNTFFYMSLGGHNDLSKNSKASEWSV